MTFLSIADDFTGAAEIAGIAFRYGLQTAIQLEFNPAVSAEVIVVDAGTRGLSEADAVQKTRSLVRSIKNQDKTFIFFKKTDSVFRGHILPEINIMLETFPFNKILLLPANPGRGRKIIGGRYEIDGIPLDQTAFHHDPDFPITTSSVMELLAGKESIYPLQHLQAGDHVPDFRIVTGDAVTQDDTQQYFRDITVNDLCCGGGESFEALLQHYGHRPGKAATNFQSERRMMLVINGSTFRVKEESTFLKVNNIGVEPVPGTWRDDFFFLSGEEASAWHRRVHALLQERGVAVIHVDQPVKRTADVFLTYLAGLITYLSQFISMKEIHFSFTGGATAAAMLALLSGGTYRVQRELAPGVVTILDEQTGTLFTVKPGSYPWPDFFLHHLSGHHHS